MEEPFIDYPLQVTHMADTPLNRGIITDDMRGEYETLERHCISSPKTDPMNTKKPCDKLKEYIEKNVN